ncbi:MAG: DUF1592 domain-containing protein [Deltaproteobacteria bacterium]|nr:DUF1592 domain-containing protein [Nannocystaceae bacterium]
MLIIPVVRNRLAAIAWLATCSASACYRGGGAGGDASPSTEGAGSDADTVGDGSDADGSEGDDVPPPLERESSPGVRLLTQREYHNAVRDLLGVTLERDLVPREQIIEGHGQISWAQGVGLTDVESYYDLAEQAAREAVPLLDLGCTLDSHSCVDPFVEDFLHRAFREPVASADVASYLAILDAPEAGEDMPTRLQTLIAAALSSPRFLYRRELGGEAVGDDPWVRWLDDYEIAARMSFFVWQSVPDQALLDDAAAGALRDAQVRAMHLARMLDDDRARTGQVGFVIDWLGVHGDARISDKDPEVLEGTSAQLEAAADRSLERTIQDVLFDGAGRFAAILGADRYWVDGELASLLELDPVGGELESRAVDPSVRLGLLMHPTVLAAHTKESGASPFTIGKFVYENVLCEAIPPPVDLPEFDPEANPDQTLREQLEALTAPAECQGCHARIGPPGFAFLAFDAIGRHSFEDGLGRPIDTSGTIPVADTTVSFESAAELAQALADHDHTARCMTRRLFRWTYGYFEGDAAEDHVLALTDESIAARTGMYDVLLAITTSDEFAQVRRGGE